MKVRDMMTPDPATILQDATLREAIELMEAHQCRHLPVVNPHGYLVGVITSHDCRLTLNIPSLMRKHWQSHHLLDHTLVSAVMTFTPEVIDIDAPAEEAVTRMLNKQIGCLPVIQNDELVGIVTTTDILRAFIPLPKPVLTEEKSH